MSDHIEQIITAMTPNPLEDLAVDAGKQAVSEASNFFKLICKPAAEELGFMLRDFVKNWRINNLDKVAKKSKLILDCSGDYARFQGHPRIVSQIMEQSSWVDDENIQDMWAGLLASSRTYDGRDDSNHIFISVLSRLTFGQARILDYACKTAKKSKTTHGLIKPETLLVDVETLKKVSGNDDIHVIDQELDSLRSMELIVMGFINHMNGADVTPTALALNMYVRCKGSRQSAVEFFDVKV